MQLLLLIIFVSYILFVAWLWWGWRRTMRVRQTQVERPLLSVIVSARNEEHTILELLRDLEKQTYSPFEVLVVDDHSEDATANVVRQFIAKTPLLRLRLLETELPGKKAALTTAVKQATGNWIITTDADCRVERDWLLSMAAQFAPAVNMVVGPVRMEATNFFSRLQQMEFASLVGSGAATFGWKVPTMANGANLAYRKKVFEEVGGYTGNEHIASGDDEFLMGKIAHRFPTSIAFCTDRSAVVQTKAQPTFSDFFNQRMRWASKWKQRSGNSTQLIAVFVFASQLTFLAAPWLVLTGWLGVTDILPLWLAKAAAEFFFFRPVLRLLSIPFSWAAFLVLQFLYPYYVMAVAGLSLVTSYRWKERYHNE